MHKITAGSQIRYLLIILTLLISITSISGVNGAFTLNITSDHTNSSCNSSNDGSITINVTGGDGNYNYNWQGPNSFSATSKDISNLVPGSYTVIVTDDSDGERSETVTVTEPDELIITNSTTTPVSCNGSSDGTATAGTVAGGNMTFQYSIDGSNFQNSKTFNGLAAGSHTITVRDEKGCEDFETVTVTQPDPLNITGSTTTPVSCNGGSDGTINAGTITGGNTTFQYSIDGSNFQNSKTFNGLAAGSHTITVRDDKGCEDFETVTVTQPDPLNITGSTTTPVSCNGGSDGTINAGTITGGNTTFQYSIDGSNFQNSKTFNGLIAGSHTITVRDDKGCEDFETVTVTQPDPLSITGSTTTPVSCNGSSDGTATAGTVAGGNTTFQYSIDGTNFQNSKTFSGLNAGTYTITVRDDKGCLDSDSITVTQPDELVISGSTTTPVSCNGGSDGTITAGTITGGNTTFQYSIDGTNFQNSKTFSGLNAGTYTITVRDDKGCLDSDSITVTQPDELVISGSTTTPVSCNGGSDGTINAGTITGGNTTFQYSIDGTNFQNSKTFSGLNAGTYTITVRDDKGCQDTEIVTVAEPDELIITNSTTTPVSCNGGNDGSVTAGTITGGNTTFQYSIDGSNFQNSKTFNGLAAGSHTITVRDDKGCEDFETVTVTQPDPLNITGSTTTPVSCNGGSDGTINAGTITGGNTTFQYSIDGSNFQNSKTFNGLIAGSHTITVRDDKGCEDFETVTVTQPDPLSITGSTTTPVSCNGSSDGTATAGTVAGGNTTFQYSIDGTNFQNSKTFSGLNAGTYTITVRDDKGCLDSDSITVTQPDELVISGSTTTPVSCNGGSDGTINAGTITGGNTTFQYSIDGTNFQNSKTFSGLNAGTYTITVRDDKGCQDTEIVTVAEPDELIITNSTTTPVSCNGGNDGSVTAGTISGGNTTYQYSIDGSNFQNSKTFNGLIAGSHTITVRDDKGCEDFETVTVTQPDPLSITGSTTTPVSCNGSSDGTATAGTVAGGNTTFQYSIDGTNFQSSKSFNVLSAGSYTITVRDDKGCEDTETVNVAEPEELGITNSTTTPVSCNGGADGSISSGTVTGGTPPYEYSLDNSNFQTSTTFNNLSAGDYTVFIKDANDCAIQDNITVNEPDVLNANLSKTNVLCNGGASGTISLSDLEGGSGTYLFSIDNTNWQTETTFSGLTAGDYPIYIRDASATSCIILLNNSYSITEPTVLEATATSTPTTTFGSSTGSAMVNPSGGTSGYTYEWRATGDTEVITTTRTANNLSAGEYEVTVIDANGCQVIVSSIIVRDAITGEVESATLCEGENVQDGQVRTAFFRLADFTALGGYGNYEYIWDFGSGIPTETGPGQHAVKYNTSGNKTITVTITDRDDQGNIFQTITLTQQQYVGLCHEPCGQAQNAQFDVDAIYIGYLNGDSMEGNSADLCNDTIDKYLFLPVSKNVNMYNPYTEITFKTTNAATDQFDNQFDDAGTGKCKDEDEIDEIPASENQGKINKVGDWIRLTVAPIEYQCGDALEIEGFYITYTNNSKMDCYSNNNGFCYSINEPVTVPTPVYVEATPTDLFCKGEATGFITARGSGGFAPYSYNITSANDAYFSNNTFNNLSAGNYTVYIQDSRGNRNSTSVTISEPDTAISVSTAKTDPECFGDLGTATATATGGTPFSGDTYEYLWNDSEEQITATATNLVAGNYTVTVTDANGCQDIKSVTIIEPEELTTSDAGPNQQLNCGIYDTKLQANTPSSGIGTWSIDTANSSTGGTILDSTDANSGFSAPAGTYTLKWTIANPDGSCASIDTVIITVDGECSMLDFDGVDDHVYFDNNYNFTTGSFTFEVWVKPEAVSGTQTIFSKRDKSNLSSGGYDLIINGGSPTFRWKGKTATTNKKITTARWHHLAVIFQSNTARLYVDGIEVGTATAANPANTSSPFILGAMYDSSTPLTPKNYYSGWMEELRIWNTALSPDQLRFMMNQRVESNDGITKGDVLPFNVPNDLLWSNLAGYYRLQIEDITGGITPDISSTKVDGILRNITTNQYTSAPLPYVSEDNGNWRERGTWDTNIGNTNEKWWSVPNDKGINDQQINWNIVKTRHNITSGSQDIRLLGLISEANKLEIEGDVASEAGQGLTISKYLDIDGVIDLNGNSQLVQTEGSILAASSTGYIDIDQQGTANSFNYNYWSSPVSITGSANNSGFTIGGVLMDGTDPDNPKSINFNGQYHWADGSYAGNKRISTYWLYNFGDPEDDFNGDADDYLSWSQFDESELLPPGIGYTMKGTTGYVPISTRQNYTFRGKPNNGDIEVQVAVDQNLLTGNPYPSAIDALQFINENLSDFNGALYFWDHFGKEDSHYLEEYVGGYAVYNLSGGISSASSIDSRINDNDESSQKDPPGQFIPVGQAFFINTLGVNNPLTITYKNKYRAFILESDQNNGNNLSQFHSQEKENPKENHSKASLDERHKIRLKFESPKGYHRQILVTADENTTSGFDLGYDAPLIENNVEDMYWMVDSTEFVIQAVPDFALERILPLGIKIAETGEFTIKIDETENIKSGFEIYLRDRTIDEYYKISEQDFTTTIEETGFFNDRFELVFRSQEENSEEEEEKDGPVEETPIEAEKPNLNPEDAFLGLQYYKNTDEIALSNPDLLNITQVEIYSISGQKIMSFNDIPTERSVQLRIRQKLSSAVYVVKLYSGKKVYSKKVIISK